MNGYPARVDANQPEIVRALKLAGATVQHLHTVGRGCPDIVVGWNGANYLLEIKAQAGRMTGDEQQWHDAWRGQVAVVRNVREALAAIGAAEYVTEGEK